MCVWLGTLLLLASWTAATRGLQCGVAGGATKIVGGESVGSLQYPWYVALVSPTGSSTLQVSCGGSLITSRHVLSAAHCFPRTAGTRPEQLYRAVLGLVNRCSQTHADQVTIARVRVHPEYNEKTLQSDVSVVTLQRAVDYTPVCLPPRNHQPYGPAVIIGFGSTLAKSQYPCTLQQAQVNILSRRQCAQSSLAPEYSHVPGTFCAGVAAGGVDSCDGDSGGPIMTIGEGGAYTVQGIVSFGEGCARKNLPGVYTTVTDYRDFIVSSVSSTDDLLVGDGDSSTLTPVDPEDPLPSTPQGPTTSTPPPPSSLLDSVLAMLAPWVAPDSAAASSSGVDSSATASGSGVVAHRPLSPLEYFLLQLFNRNHRRTAPPARVRPAPAYPWTLG